MILAKQNTDQCAGALGQRLLEEFGRSGELDRQIERARDFYRHRRDLLLDALQRHMPEGVSWTRPEGGFVTWLTLPVDVDADGLAQEALDEAVAFVPGSVFFARPGARRNYLRLSYSLVADDEMEEGIRRLGALLRRALGTTKGERTMGNGQRMRGDTRSIDSDIV
jgi:2-aminoadipate transaminase